MKMKNFIVVAVSIFILSGCKMDMITSVKTSDINNQESKVEIVQGEMIIEISGSCTDKETGAESDYLVEADGVMFNLFGNNHKRINCEPIDKYGFNSKIYYTFDIALYTGKKDVPIDEKHNIAIRFQNNQIALIISDKMRKRINARIDDNLELNLYLDIFRDTPENFEISSMGMYVLEGSKYKPYQLLNKIYKKEKKIRLKAGLVGIDTLLQKGKMWFCVLRNEKLKG